MPDPTPGHRSSTQIVNSASIRSQQTEPSATYSPWTSWWVAVHAATPVKKRKNQRNFRMMNKEDNKPVATFFPSLKHIQFFGISINSIYSQIINKSKFALYNYGKFWNFCNLNFNDKNSLSCFPLFGLKLDEIQF